MPHISEKNGSMKCINLAGAVDALSQPPDSPIPNPAPHSVLQLPGAC